jgi:hypothetical protein
MENGAALDANLALAGFSKWQLEHRMSLLNSRKWNHAEERYEQRFSCRACLIRKSVTVSLSRRFRSTSLSAKQHSYAS